MSWNSLLTRFLTQPVPPTSGPLSLPSACPASRPIRPTTSPRVTSCRFSSQIPCSSPLWSSQVRAHSASAGPPAQSCRAYGLIFLKHGSDWLKKQPPPNQKLKRSSTLYCSALSSSLFSSWSPHVPCIPAAPTHLPLHTSLHHPLNMGHIHSLNHQANPLSPCPCQLPNCPSSSDRGKWLRLRPLEPDCLHELSLLGHSVPQLPHL